MLDNKFSYKVNGREIRLQVDTDLIALKFKEPSPKSARSNFVNKSDQLADYAERLELPGEKFTIFKLAEVQKERPVRYNVARTSLANAEEITDAMPVFTSGDKKILATDKIVVGFEEQGNSVEGIVAKYQLEKIEDSFNSYLFKVPDSQKLFELVKQIENEPGVKYAEPNFVTIGSHSAKPIRPTVAPAAMVGTMGEDLSGSQYAIKITQADKAWQLQKGNRDIKIAILDEGVDTAHPDLKDVVVKSFDAIDNDGFQEPNDWDGHGTSCCGLAAANHKSFGIKGLSAGCTVYAVRIAQSLTPGGDWITDNFKIRTAIDWSWMQGADIISNSWGGGLPSNDISEAFDRARLRGRGGKGSVIIIAAGNNDSAVTFPGNLMEVLTVSASNEYDEAKTKFSRDGEYWWGSCFGPEIDIAAPGVHNLTIDIAGGKGYNDSNYTDFNGTSSATPIVAGIVGLVLSSNPNLLESEVRNIIKTTGDKVGNVTYFQGHNDRMGFGRVNAYRAVVAALSSAQH